MRYGAAAGSCSPRAAARADLRRRPPDRAAGHVRRPASCRAGRPGAAVVETDDGRQAWRYEDRDYPNIGLNAVVGPAARTSGAWRRPASTRCARGCCDIQARIADMDLAGDLGVAVLPVADRRVRRRGVLPRARTRSSDSPCCGRGTTGTTRCGRAPIPERIIPLQIAWLTDPRDRGGRECGATPSAASRR